MICCAVASEGAGNQPVAAHEGSDGHCHWACFWGTFLGSICPATQPGWCIVISPVVSAVIRTSPPVLQVLTRKAAVEVFISILLAQGTPTADTLWLLGICNVSLILGLVFPRHCVASHPPFRSLQVRSLLRAWP